MRGRVEGTTATRKAPSLPDRSAEPRSLGRESPKVKDTELDLVSVTDTKTVTPQTGHTPQTRHGAFTRGARPEAPGSRDAQGAKRLHAPGGYLPVPVLLLLMSASLLDNALERITSAGRDLQPIVRVCLIGRLASGSSADTFSKWCGNEVKNSSEVTGLLVQLPNSWIMTLEGPDPSLVPLLRTVLTQIAPGAALAKCTVIASQEDVRSRYFPSWASKAVSVQRSNYTEFEGDAQLAALLSDTAIGTRPALKSLSGERPRLLRGARATNCLSLTRSMMPSSRPQACSKLARPCRRMAAACR